MYKQIITLTLLAVASYAQISNWSDCGTTGATIHSINVGDCTTAPCPFVRGNTYDIRVLATALSGSNHLPYEVIATFFGVNATVMSGNVCDHVTCPTAAGHSIDFGYSYTVSEIFPPIPSTVITEVLNHEQARTMCFSFPIQIV